MAPPRSRNPDRTDPRRLRELLVRAAAMAVDHGVRTVVIGMSGREEDRLLAEFMDFVESALRMEDSIFRMTRERSVLFLTDVDQRQAESIVQRLVESFTERFPSRKGPDLVLGFYHVEPDAGALTVRDVLLTVFPKID